MLNCSFSFVWIYLCEWSRIIVLYSVWYMLDVLSSESILTRKEFFHEKDILEHEKENKSVCINFIHFIVILLCFEYFEIFGWKYFPDWSVLFHGYHTRTSTDERQCRKHQHHRLQVCSRKTGSYHSSCKNSKLIKC